MELEFSSIGLTGVSKAIRNTHTHTHTRARRTQRTGVLVLIFFTGGHIGETPGLATAANAAQTAAHAAPRKRRTAQAATRQIRRPGNIGV